MSSLKEKIQKVLDDAYEMGRTDSYLKVNDYSRLKSGMTDKALKAFEDCLPEKIDMLDVGELGGEDGSSGFSAVAVSHKNGFNQAIDQLKKNMEG